MAYSTAWDDNRPAGTEAAKHIDDEIRLLRAQITERMSGLLVVDWTADPLVAIGASGPGAKTIIIPHTAFLASAAVDYASYTGTYVQASYAAVLRAPVILPQGSTLLELTFLVNKNTCTSINCALVKVLFSPSLTPSVPVTITNSDVGWTTVNSAAIAEDVDGFNAYYLEFTGIGSGGDVYQVAGVRIAYSS